MVSGELELAFKVELTCVRGHPATLPLTPSSPLSLSVLRRNSDKRLPGAVRRQSQLYQHGEYGKWARAMSVERARKKELTADPSRINSSHRKWKHCNGDRTLLHASAFPRVSHCQTSFS